MSSDSSFYGVHGLPYFVFCCIMEESRGKQGILMERREVNTMNDREFRSAKQEFDPTPEHDLSEFPRPDAIAPESTPWRKAMNRVLLGLALSIFTPNILCLNFILPAIGIALLLLGFRTLRNENAWFRACWIITILRTIYFFPVLIINTTIWQKTILQTSVFYALTYLNLAATLLLFIGLWGGFRAMQQKVGLDQHAGAVMALIVWYIVLCVFGLMQYRGIFIFLLLAIAYICIFRSLYKLSTALDQANYAIQTAPLHLSDRVLIGGLVAILVVGMTIGYYFFNQYPMEWYAVETTEQQNLEETKAHLMALGFPEKILANLTADDLRLCQGALRVIATERELPMNDRLRADGQPLSTAKELTLKSVAVELPGEVERWKLFHHFRWTVNPKYYGTDAIQLWPTYRSDFGWAKDGDFSGRVLYDKNDQTYASSYHSLGEITYQKSNFFFLDQTSTDVFAAFSFPKRAKQCRGYVSYPIIETVDGTNINSFFNYIHHRSWLQYPVQTAMDHTLTYGLGFSGAFFLIQLDFCFDSSDPNAKPF